MTVIEVDSLKKRYGNLQAVDGISFQVEEGEIFGIVGPNGAGKTTSVECIEGIKEHDSGRVRVLGFDPVKQSGKLKQLIGIQLQEGMLPDRMKVWEALDLFSALYKRSVPWGPLLDELGLAPKRNDYFDNLSGGQKQRLSIAMSLVNDPQVVFFDELTTGLDPQARRAIWDLVRRVRDKGKTVILVTHFMEEAERLCDRVAIIDHGKIIAIDSPRQLIQNLEAGIHIHFSSPADGLGQQLGQVRDVVQVGQEGDRFFLLASQLKAIADVINLLVDKEIPFDDFAIQQPNLEDVFIQLTGRKIRD